MVINKRHVRRRSDHMRSKIVVGLSVLALTLPGFAGAASPNAGKQASQCFAMYKIAEQVPANAAHRNDLKKLQGLMTWSIQKNSVSQKQFTAWSGEMMDKMGSPKKPNKAFMNAQIQSCNGFAQSQYAELAREKRGK